jgi:mannose-1-phosphate guanylyltransferase
MTHPMTQTFRKSGGLWPVVLAGGEGQRMGPLVRRWLGRHRPKQYCTFTGTRSMFQHTVDRALELAPPERIVSVIARSHEATVLAQLDGRNLGALVLQPANRDTAAGIFLPLTYIRAQDPDATVVILPSDHFVSPEDRFLEIVRHATQAAESLTDRLILVAVEPDGLELEYGWIEPGSDLVRDVTPRVRAVDRFLEKPDAARATEAMATGGLWNTLVLAAKVDTLWTLGWRCFPEMMPLFERLRYGIGSADEHVLLDEIYRSMPARNFSSGLLEQVPQHVAVIEANGLQWSDWGNPERIADTLLRLGKQPAFPLDLIASPITAGA